MSDEGAQVWCERVGGGVVRTQGIHRESGDIERQIIRGGIAGEDEAGVIVADGEGSRSAVSGPSQLAAGREARVKLGSRSGVNRARVNLARRFHLGRGETARRVAAGAEQRGGVELTAARIFDDAIGYAIERIAGVERGVIEQRIFGGRNVGGIVPVNNLRDPERPHGAACPIGGGRSGNDAVEILGDIAGPPSVLDVRHWNNCSSRPNGARSRSRFRSASWRRRSSHAPHGNRNRLAFPDGRKRRMHPEFRRTCGRCR